MNKDNKEAVKEIQRLVAGFTGRWITDGEATQIDALYQEEVDMSQVVGHGGEANDEGKGILLDDVVRIVRTQSQIEPEHKMTEEKIAVLIGEDRYRYRGSFYGEYITEQDREHCRQIAHQILEALAGGELTDEAIKTELRKTMPEDVIENFGLERYRRVARAQTIRLNAQHELDMEEHTRLVEVARAAGKADGYKEGLADCQKRVEEIRK